MQERDLTPAQRNTLGEVFDKIKKSASISQEERKGKRRIVMEVLHDLTLNMKKDKLFDEIFQEFRYTGSYFDNLRITDANEFDINIVLSLPVRRDKIRVESKIGSYSNFAALCLDYTDGDPIVNYLDTNTKNQFSKLLDTDGRVLPDKVLSWMQSVLAKAFNYLQSYNYLLRMSASGPAKTIKITRSDTSRITLSNPYDSIDVDLVPVFRIEPGQWKEDSRYFEADIVGTALNSRRRMYLVPKTHPQLPNYFWRKHFPEVEEELLNGKLAAKPVIRILKLFRDNRNWKRIASYYLKTLVMIEVVRHRSNPGYWHDSRTPYLVFKMLDKLKSYLQERALPHVLYRRVNLLQGLHTEELYNYSNGLQRIYTKCVQNINIIEIYFIPVKSEEENENPEAQSWFRWLCTLL